MTQIRIDVDDRYCTIDLLTAEAPETVKGLLEMLPLDTVITHAKFAGEEMILMLPRLLERENMVSSVARGDVCYYPDRQTICIFYGDIVPFGAAGLFGRVSKDDGLLKSGGDIWRRPQPARISVVRAR
jgi:hypothetical protein